jgi:Tol biopolymer transport system component
MAEKSVTALKTVLVVLVALGLSAGAQSAEIAYSRLTNGYWQIWIYSLATQQHHQLSVSPFDKRYPAWAPGDTVVFRSNGDALYRASADGAEERPFLQNLWPALDPSFAPDGLRVALARLRTDVSDVSAIWLADARGDAARVLTRGPGLQVRPTWSPDGKWLAFIHSRGIHGADLRRVSVDGRTNELLVEAREAARCERPAWSPDGRAIAYASNESGDYEIWLVAVAETGEPRKLTQATELTQAIGLDTAPAWSPDGTQLAFTSRRRAKLEIWTMNADGSAPSPLFQVADAARDPAWR